MAAAYFETDGVQSIGPWASRMPMGAVRGQEHAIALGLALLQLAVMRSGRPREKTNGMAEYPRAGSATIAQEHDGKYKWSFPSRRTGWCYRCGRWVIRTRLQRPWELSQPAAPLCKASTSSFVGKRARQALVMTMAEDPPR